MIAYLDSSIVLRALLNQPRQFTAWDQVSQAFASQLLEVECHRVLDRYRLEGHLTDHELAESKTNLAVFLRGVTLLSISSSVIKRASSPFPTILGSLDAIHLATALLWQETNKASVLMVTFNDQLRVAAKACGIEVFS